MVRDKPSGLDEIRKGFIFKAGAAKGCPPIRLPAAGSFLSFADNASGGLSRGSFITAFTQEDLMPKKRKDPHDPSKDAKQTRG